MPTIRIIAVALSLILSGCAAVSPTPVSAEIIFAGLYSVDDETRINASESLTGKITKPGDVRPVLRTRNVIAKLGRTFGIAYVLSGSGGAPIEHRVVWHFPGEGIKSPTGQISKSFTWKEACAPAQVCTTGQIFREDWEMIPGRWDVEIWQGPQQLARQEFWVSLN